MLNHIDPFKKFVLYSAIGHGLLLLFYNLNLIFFPHEAVDLKSSVSVEMVALPDKLPTKPKPSNKKEIKVSKPEKKQKKTIETKKIEDKKTKAIALDKKTKSKKKSNDDKIKQQLSAIDKIKRLESIESIKKELEAEEKEMQQEENTVTKGNKLSEGSQLTGIDKIQFQTYYDKIQNHLNEHWSLPQWLNNEELKTQVLVKMNEEGYITSKSISKSSNNDIFDEHVLDTLDKASPFPPPPSRLTNYVKNNGIYFNFPEN